MWIDESNNGATATMFKRLWLNCKWQRDLHQPFDLRVIVPRWKQHRKISAHDLHKFHRFLSHHMIISWLSHDNQHRKIFLFTFLSHDCPMRDPLKIDTLYTQGAGRLLSGEPGRFFLNNRGHWKNGVWIQWL